METFRYDSVGYERDAATQAYCVYFFGEDEVFESVAYNDQLGEGKWNSQEAKDTAIMTAALDNALVNGCRLLINPRPVRFMCRH